MRIVCVLLGACVLGCAPFGSVRTPLGTSASLGGNVVAETGALSVADLSRAVVYLEAIDAPPPQVRRSAFRIRHSTARFAPNLVAVAPGDKVWFVNDDPIFHGVFSYSRPNAFDLGVYAPGKRRAIRFAHAGAVLIHCPIHSGEVGVVFVVPTRLVVRPSPRGIYRIQGAPAGRYWLRAWADGFPEVAYDVTLRAGQEASRDVVLAPARPTSAARGAPVETGSPGPPPPGAAHPRGSPGSRRTPTPPAGRAAPGAPRPRRSRAARAPCPSRRWSA
jgi:plastocyanin